MRKSNRIPAELKPDQVTAIVDSREQIPLDLSPLRIVAGTLTTGDYSVKGLDHVAAIERKSLPPFFAGPPGLTKARHFSHGSRK